MDLPSYFTDFLENIRPTQEQRRDASEAHKRLRNRLAQDRELKDVTLLTFLQGSYRRSTDVKPLGDKKSDVDLIVVTTMAEDQWTAPAALDRFIPFLERNYPDAYEPQSRSWGLIDGTVELDLVPTSAPSESVYEQLRALRESAASTEIGLPVFEEAIRKTAALAKDDAWKRFPLRIPDRDRRRWEDTHPLKQIEETQRKNARTGGRFVDVVRAMKWWRLRMAPAIHPKSYPLEAIVFETCPDGIGSIAEGFVLTCTGILQRFRPDMMAGRVPTLADHGVPTNNVLKRVTIEEFARFYNEVVAVEPQARAALADPTVKGSANAWRAIFGPEFPPPPDDRRDDADDDEGPFQPPRAPARAIGRGNFA